MHDGATESALSQELAAHDARLQALAQEAERMFARSMAAFGEMLDMAMDARAREIVFEHPDVTQQLLAEGRLPILKTRLAAMRQQAETITRDALAGSRAWFHRSPAAGSTDAGREVRPVLRASGAAELPFDFRTEVDAAGRAFDECFREFGYRSAYLNFGSVTPSPDVVVALEAYADAVKPYAEVWEQRQDLARRRDQAAALEAWDAITAMPLQAVA